MRRRGFGRCALVTGLFALLLTAGIGQSGGDRELKPLILKKSYQAGGGAAWTAVQAAVRALGGELRCIDHDSRLLFCKFGPAAEGTYANIYVEELGPDSGTQVIAVFYSWDGRLPNPPEEPFFLELGRQLPEVRHEGQ